MLLPTADYEGTPQERYWLLLGDIALSLDEPRKIQQRMKDRFRQLCDDVNRNRLVFLCVEIELGLTFARIASGAQVGSEKRARSISNALKAYDGIMRLRRSVLDQQAERFKNDIRVLENALEELGVADTAV